MGLDFPPHPTISHWQLEKKNNFFFLGKKKSIKRKLPCWGSFSFSNPMVSPLRQLLNSLQLIELAPECP